MARVVVLPRAERTVTIDAASFDEGPAAVDPNTAAPQNLNAYVVLQDPKITVFPHFLSDAECDHLLSLAEGGWFPSYVGGQPSANYVEAENKQGEGLENSITESRTSWSCMLRYFQTSVVNRVENRVATICGLPVEQLEPLFMVRYAPGEAFNEHHDGKFRPKTVFVYLNDLPEDDEQGDTFFPHLGVSFKPRRGAAVMWSNALDGKEDSRMLHAGRAPFKGIKYGVNCFTNDRSLRRLADLKSEYSLETAATVRAADFLREGGGPIKDGNGQPAIRAFKMFADLPGLMLVPGLLLAAEVEQFLDLARGAKQSGLSASFSTSTQLLHLIDAGATPMVQEVEQRIVAAAQDQPLAHLARLRIVRPGTEVGLVDRGRGKSAVFISLTSRQDVFFPYVGVRIELGPGDGIVIPNVEWSTGKASEDLRTLRIHLKVGDEELLGIDAHFDDNPIRDQPARRFVRDDEVAQPQKA